MKEIMIDASKLTYLENSPVFSYILEFIKNLDNDYLDNIYSNIIENIPSEKLEYVFDVITKTYYYISFLINSNEPDICSFKVIKYYISNGKILLKIKLKEL